MGYLFENMEKIDIQEERRISAKIRNELADTYKELENANKELESTNKELESTTKALRDTQQQATQTLIQTVISFCQQFNASKETTHKELMERCHLSSTEADKQLLLYWENTRGE